MSKINTHDLAITVKNMYANGELTAYQKFDLLLKIDQNDKLDEIIKRLKK